MDAVHSPKTTFNAVTMTSTGKLDHPPRGKAARNGAVKVLAITTVATLTVINMMTISMASPITALPDLVSRRPACQPTKAKATQSITDDRTSVAIMIGGFNLTLPQNGRLLDMLRSYDGICNGSA
jgi:hypothetical protein